MTSGIRAWLRNLFRRPAVEASLDEEMRATVDLLAAGKVRAGVSPADARRQALLEIGGVEAVKERVRDVRRASLVEAFFRDLRHAGRILRKRPLLTGAIVITLGVGIGSPASAFSLLNRFIFAPPSSPDPDHFFRLTKTFGRNQHQTTITIDEYLAFRDRATSARQVAAWSVWMMHAPLGADDPSLLTGSLVSCNLLTLFKVDVPVVGRLLTPGDCDTDVPVAVLNERTWRSRFGADPAIVGATMRYGAAQVSIVGVAAAPSLRRQWDDADELVDLFVPYTAYRQMRDVADFARSGHGWLHVGGVLQPGVARDAAAAEFQSISVGALPQQTSEQRQFFVTNGSRWAEAPAEMLGILAMALALPALVLFMACVNVSALLLSRSVGRRREMAVRLALGTSRAALVRMLLTESVLMAGLAAAIGLLFILALPPLLVRFLDAETWFGAAETLRPDWRVLVALGVCGIAAAVLSGLTPALTSLNPRPADSLKERPDSGLGRGVSRTRRWLVGIQIAASMVPLVAAMAFARTVGRITEPGLTTENLLVAPIPAVKPRDVSVGVLAGALRSTPGVDGVAFGASIPLTVEQSIGVQGRGNSTPVFPVVTFVSGTYFDVVGIPILAGRSFERQDEALIAGPKPVIVSSRFARLYFGDGSAIGETIETAPPGTVERWTIVGIAGDRLMGPTISSATLTDGSMIYQLMPASSKSGVLFVKTAGSVDALADPVGARLRALTGTATPVQTMAASLAEMTTGIRRVSLILLSLGVVGFLLAIVGVVGTVSYDARQRRKEFAIRFALGADPWAVRRRVISTGLWPVAPALGAGLLASWGALSAADAQRLAPLRSIALDPHPYATVGLLLIVTAVLTLLAVAYPAGRRDPLPSLREE